jgi:hypothetical protein
MLGSDPLHRDLKFYTYYRVIKEGVDGLAPLKPGGIGVHGIVRKGDVVSWRKIEVIERLNLPNPASSGHICSLSFRRSRESSLCSWDHIQPQNDRGSLLRVSLRRRQCKNANFYSHDRNLPQVTQRYYN